MEVLGLVGKKGSEHKCSECSRGRNIVNKNLFLPELIVGSFTKAPHGQARLLGYNSVVNIIKAHVVL